VNERELRERMRDAPVPDERDAEERGWRVVRAAYDGRQPLARRRRRVRLALAPAAVALLALVLATSGTAIGDWLRDLARPGREHAKPALSSLPARGRLLVTSPSGPWVVKADGSKRLLGSYGEASWSPHGLFVISARGRQLVATEPSGRVRWTLARPAPVTGPRWSPSGYRIVYLTGGSLRVVAGDGTGDRTLIRAVADTPAAWKPGVGHVLAYAGRDGSVHVVGADTKRLLWRSRPGPVADELAWSADGQRLAVRAPGSVRIFDARGRLLRTMRVAAATLRFAPNGHQFALARSPGVDDQSDVALIEAERHARPPRALFVGAGALTDLAWSPDGRWLLIGWPSADQWVFVRTEGGRRVTAVSNVGRQFNPGGRGNAAFPSVSGWCCARQGSAG
jgi:WD40 repeat protein